MECDRRRRREKGARQGRKQGAEPAKEFAKSGECVFEWAMKNLTPATISRSKKAYHGFESPEISQFRGTFLHFFAFFAAMGLVEISCRKNIISKNGFGQDVEQFSPAVKAQHPFLRAEG